MNGQKLKVSQKDPFFGPATESMRMDVLNAILSLNRTNDPNFMKIREWIMKEHEVLLANAAYSIGIGEAMSNSMKGMALLCGAINFYFAEPQMAIAAYQRAKAAAATHQQAIPPTGSGIS